MDIAERNNAKGSDDTESKTTEKTTAIGNQAEKLLPLPPDGGYGWVIVFVCFICNGIVEGSVGSFGIFLPHFTEAFGSTRGKVTIAGSLLIGGFLISGSIVSGLINCFGCRVVTMVGSLLTVLAFTLSTLSPNIDVFITIYGFIGGFGLAMIYLPAMVMVGYYFERRRSLATGIAYSGAGIGMVIMAPVCAGFVSAYDWRNALILLATFPLQGIVMGALMRPLSALGTNSENNSESTMETDNDVLLSNSQKPISSKSERMVSPTDILLGSNRLIPPQNVLYPSLSAHNIGKENSLKTLSLFALEPQCPNQLENPSSKGKLLMTQSCVDLPSDPHSRIKTWVSHSIQNRNRIQSQNPQAFISCQKLAQLPDDYLHQIDMKKLREEICKPLARRDVFYSGSVHQLPEYQQQPDQRSYIASVTMVPTEDMDKGVSKSCPCVSKSTVNTLKDMLQCNLLFHPHFFIICLSSVFIQLGYFVPIVFLPDYALSMEVSPQSAALLISVIGLANTVGRAGCGALANLQTVNSLHLNNICLIACGSVTLLACQVCTTFPLLIIYAALFGLLMGAFVPLTTIFLVQYLGLHRLNNAMGLLSMVRGLSSMAGPPIAGALLDKNSSYGPVFYFAGSMFITAGIMFYLLPLYSTYASRFTAVPQNEETQDPEEC